MSKNSVEKAANPSSSPIRIVILGSGFAAIEVLKKLQKEFYVHHLDMEDKSVVPVPEFMCKKILQISLWKN